MPELPTGTVTFLFTDIEGSTRLLDELGERYADALAEHRRVLREAFARHGGVEVDTQGDAFFVAFGDAGSALAAAEEAQRHLELPVRMGVHSGEPAHADGGYVGMDVHRAARICAAAHGRQVVLSARAHDLVTQCHLAFRDLGLHRLKDLAEPVRLYQLGEREFPPLRSLNATNLPVQPTPLVGREQEVAEVTALVRGGARLVTLTGPGGTGKTRLALQAAAELVDEFRDGIFWVPLAAIRDPELVLPTIEQTVGARTPLRDHIDEKRILLLLDNLEQVVDCAPSLGDALVRCPNLTLLVTSRVLLRVQAEHDYPVSPLARDEAVTLFCERAVDAQPEEAVREICSRLDGLPLAIELAAARTRILPPEKLLERLERRLPLLTGGARDAPERQRALRATIEWSHELLSADEQKLFRRASVFAGGFTLEAVEQVAEADLDTLQGLVEHSLIRRGGERFTMLQTIREYATERLDADDDPPAVRERHFGWFLHVAEEARAAFETPKQGSWHERVNAEFDDFREAVGFALASGSYELVLRIAVTLGRYLWTRPAEAATWLERALAGSETVPPELLGEALCTLGECRWFLGEHTKALARFQESLAIARTLGDERAEARLLTRLGPPLAMIGRLDASNRTLEKAVDLHRRLGQDHELALTLGLSAGNAFSTGDLTRADRLFEESLAIARRLGDSFQVENALLNLADVALTGGDLPGAEKRARESIRLAWAIDDRLDVLYGLATLAAAAAERRLVRRAAILWGAAERLDEELGTTMWDRDRADWTERVGAAAVGDEEGRRQGRALTTEQAIELACRT